MALRPVCPLLYSWIMVALFSCQKQIPLDNSDDDKPLLNQPGTTINCNDTKQQLVKRTGPQPGDSIVVNYHDDGRLNQIASYSDLRPSRGITLVYENGRPIGGDLHDLDLDQSLNRVLFRYDISGRIDSMYVLGNSNADRRFVYDKYGLINKIIGYTNGQMAYYYEIQNNEVGNITSYTRWQKGANGMEKQEEAALEWDDRKNPFAPVAIFMFYLDSEEEILKLSCPNNFRRLSREKTASPNQSQSEGNRLVYNNNCYPQAAYSIVDGMTQQSEPDIKFLYK